MQNRLEVSQLSKNVRSKTNLPGLAAQQVEIRCKELPVCLCGPERYEPRYRYPLIVWLHSCHSDERELAEVMPGLSLQNYVACAPRGTGASEACGQKFHWGQSRTAIALAEESVFAAVREAQSQFSVAPDKIFLAGFGSGATTAWRIALRYPHEFAGVVAICGKFPQDHLPLTNFASARGIPTLWMYGGHSANCGIDHLCQVLPVMHAARLLVNIRQYPCANELLSNMLADANSWLMEHVTNQVSPVERMFEESFSRN